MNNQDILKLAPLPNMDALKRVLFVGPHPDDIEISSGGYVKKLIDSGCEVHFLIVTDGGSGSLDRNITSKQLKSIRKQESINAGNLLKVKSVEVLDFPDGGIYNLKNMVVEIAKRIIAIKPNSVFCPDPLLPTEIHADHLNCAKATQEALMVSKFPLSAKRHGIKIKPDQELPKGMNLIYYYTHRPNTIVEINEAQFEAKISSILCHQSQIDASFDAIKMYLYYKAVSFGQQISKQYGEGYFAMAPIHQHCFLEKIS